MRARAADATTFLLQHQCECCGSDRQEKESRQKKRVRPRPPVAKTERQRSGGGCPQRMAPKGGRRRLPQSADKSLAQPVRRTTRSEGWMALAESREMGGNPKGRGTQRVASSQSQRSRDPKGRLVAKQRSRDKESPGRKEGRADGRTRSTRTDSVLHVNFLCAMKT